MHESLLARLNEEVCKRDSLTELSKQKPDPLLVARQHKDEHIALICALFSYGSAKSIVKFLKSLDFSLLEKSEEEIKRAFFGKKYRFQTEEDIIEIFKTMRHFKNHGSIEKIFLKGYQKNHDVMEGLEFLIDFIYSLSDYDSYGYRFFFGKRPSTCKASTFKRWHMYLRWMVREDCLDIGLWSEVRKQDLLMPLDTHTFQIAKNLGLLQRKSYDFKSVLELTSVLKELDCEDPIKYDFALYRIGQENIKLIKH